MGAILDGYMSFLSKRVPHVLPLHLDFDGWAHTAIHKDFDGWAHTAIHKDFDGWAHTANHLDFATNWTFKLTKCHDNE